MTLSTSWRLTPGQHLRHRCWDGECVLYNDLTGDTHLVDAFALDILELLRRAPLPAHGLAAALGLDATDGDAVFAPAAAAADIDTEAVLAVLADLVALHLVEAAPC